MSVFEAVMLVCFGVSWPISIAKSLRTRKVEGKSPLFMAIVCFGYLNGVIYKVSQSFDWIIALYALTWFWWRWTCRCTSTTAATGAGAPPAAGHRRRRAKAPPEEAIGTEFRPSAFGGCPPAIFG